MSLMSLPRGRERRWRPRVGSRRKEKAQCRAGDQSREQIEGNGRLPGAVGPAENADTLAERRQAPDCLRQLRYSKLKVGRDANASGPNLARTRVRSLSPDRSAACTENRSDLRLA
jgi:hypothetical protein